MALLKALARLETPTPPPPSLPLRSLAPLLSSGEKLHQSRARMLNRMFATSGKPGVNLFPLELVKYQKAALFLWAPPHPEIKRSKHSVKYTSLHGVNHSWRLRAWQGMGPQGQGNHGKGFLWRSQIQLHCQGWIAHLSF